MTKYQQLQAATEEYREKLQTVIGKELKGYALTVHIHGVPEDCFSGEVTPVRHPRQNDSFMVEAIDKSDAVLIYSEPIPKDKI